MQAEMSCTVKEGKGFKQNLWFLLFLGIYTAKKEDTVTHEKGFKQNLLSPF
jgi:hypothetical protein